MESTYEDIKEHTNKTVMTIVIPKNDSTIMQRNSKLLL